MNNIKWDKLQRNIEKMEDSELIFFIEGLSLVDRPEYKIARKLLEAEIIKRDRQK